MASHTVTFTSLCFTTLILAIISIHHVVADFCQGYLDQNNGEYTEGFSCPGLFDDYEDYKCCGPSDRKYCCNYEDYSNYYGAFYWSAGKIVGVVLGAFVGFVILVVVILVICYRSFVRMRRKQRQQQISSTVSSVQPISKRTTTTQNNSHRLHALPQHARTFQPPVQAVPAAGYNPQPRGHRQQQSPPESVTYTPQSHAKPPPPDYPGLSQGFPQHAFGYDSPPPNYYAQEPHAVHTYAPEVAPPPPDDV